MRGSLLAGETLLSHGADLRLQDGRGYTACHVAAQYGQTAFIFMCALRWRADIDWCAALAAPLSLSRTPLVDAGMPFFRMPGSDVADKEKSMLFVHD